MLVAALGLTGCASIPSSGSVQRAGATRAAQPEAVVRVVPAAPRDGASPDEVVAGFLAANATYERNHEVARTYLTGAARSSWDTRRRVTVYDGDPRITGSRTGTAVTAISVTLRQIATVDADGGYTELARPAAVTERLALVRERGQWRISRPPDGLLVASTELPRTFQLAAAYFLDPTGSTVVPDLALVPITDDLPDVLVRRIIAGPVPRMRAALQTAFPAGMRLAAPVTLDSDGVAVVNLSGPSPAEQADRQALSAQVLWTLRQLPAVRAVRITVAGAPLGGAAAVQPARDSWAGFDPAVLPADLEPYAVRAGRLGTLAAKTFEPLPGPLGNGSLSLRSPGVSIDGTQVAAVVGEALHLSPVAGPLGPPTVRGEALKDVSWDRRGRVWVLDADTGTISVVAEGRVARLALPGLRGPVTGMRVSRDGVRVALVTGRDAVATLWVGAISGEVSGPAAPPTVIGLRPIEPDLGAVADVAWVDDRRLMVLPVGEGGASVGPQIVDILGYASTQLPTLPGPGLTLTAAPDATQPPVVAVRGGRETLYRLDGRNWVEIGQGRDPAYPG